jgi:molybdenum cofactor cytidylyltransferase
MGAFKPLLPFGKRTVIESCIENLSAGGVHEILVVLGHRAADLRQRLSHLPVKFALNPDNESEMSASIARGVEQLSRNITAVFIALVDQPAIAPAVIRSLIAEQQRTGARLVVPVYEGRGGHPVLIAGELRAELLHLDPERGLRALFDVHRNEVRRVPVTSAYVARDMDTWEDYRALHLEIFGLEPTKQQND